MVGRTRREDRIVAPEQCITQTVGEGVINMLNTHYVQFECVQLFDTLCIRVQDSIIAGRIVRERFSSP